LQNTKETSRISTNSLGEEVSILYACYCTWSWFGVVNAISTQL